MARTCNVCTHSEREAIDRALVGGCVQRDITRRYGIPKDSVNRHKAGHISPALVKAAERREEERAESLLDRIEELCGEARQVLEATKTDRKHATSILAIRELRACFELIGKITGELQDRPTVAINILQSPDWLEVRDVLLAALAPHPEARAAVGSALLALESGRGQELA